MDSLDELVLRGPVVPVVVLDRVEDAVPLGRALLAGGVSTMEITLRTDAALGCIEAVAKELPEMFVGAGTVVTIEDCQRVRDAGGQFMVSPGFHENLHKGSLDTGLALLPGVATATDVVRALQYGYTRLKFFPAEAAGGISALKALTGPFPQLKICPTGGIGLGNAESYLALSAVMCVGGSWLAPKAEIASGEWAAITQIATAAQALIRS